MLTNFKVDISDENPEPAFTLQQQEDMVDIDENESAAGQKSRKGKASEIAANFKIRKDSYTEAITAFNNKKFRTLGACATHFGINRG